MPSRAGADTHCREGGEFCPLCYENVRARANHRGHVGYRPVRPISLSFEESMKRNSSQASEGSTYVWHHVSDDWMVPYPLIAEYVTDTKWDDGKKRETSTITVCIDDGRLKVALNDRAMRRSLWVTARSLREAMEALETCLRSGTGEWRKWSR